MGHACLVCLVLISIHFSCFVYATNDMDNLCWGNAFRLGVKGIFTEDFYSWLAYQKGFRNMSDEQFKKGMYI